MESLFIEFMLVRFDANQWDSNSQLDSISVFETRLWVHEWNFLTMFYKSIVWKMLYNTNLTIKVKSDDNWSM